MSKRMGMSKLSQLSGIKPEATPEPESPPAATKPPEKKKAKGKKKLVNVNIKIDANQKEWLGKTATEVRDNNSEPVPPGERVYPQHLVGVAIDLLESQDIDWSEIKNERELKEYLNL